MNEKIEGLKRQLILDGFNKGVLKVNAEKPFQWASGYTMPVYNDNRLLLKKHLTRSFVFELFKETLITSIRPWHESILAGVATAGIPWSAIFADKLQTDFVYVREKPKDHGIKNQIEGLAADEEFKGSEVIVIEDLISTGGSTKKAIEAVRQADGKVKYCICIFDYGFPESKKLFEEINCEVISLITFKDVWEITLRHKYLTEEQVIICSEWQQDPWRWGEEHGFPKVEKK